MRQVSARIPARRARLPSFFFRKMRSSLPLIVHFLLLGALLHFQSSGHRHKPAFTGLFSIYATAFAKWFSSRTYRSKGSFCQNFPLLPKTLLLSCAVYDFQVWMILPISQPSSGVNNT